MIATIVAIARENVEQSIIILTTTAGFHMIATNVEIEPKSISAITEHNLTLYLTTEVRTFQSSTVLRTANFRIKIYIKLRNERW